MKSPRAKRSEPRTKLIGLNLTDAELAQLDSLFAAVSASSPRRCKVRSLTRSTVAYQCFQSGLEHQLQDKSSQRLNNRVPYDPRAQPKRNAKLVGIYLSETDWAKLTKLDSAVDLRFFGRWFLRHGKRHPFEFNYPTPLAYRCFQTGLSLLLNSLPPIETVAPASTPTQRNEPATNVCPTRRAPSRRISSSSSPRH